MRIPRTKQINRTGTVGSRLCVVSHSARTRMLCCVLGMSEKTALCITRVYPTFRRMWEAYRACATDKQRETLVADLVVSAAVAPAGRPARLGPALSKAVYQSLWLQHAAASINGRDDTLEMDDEDE